MHTGRSIEGLTCMVGEDPADYSAHCRTSVCNGQEIEGEVLGDAFGHGAHVDIGENLRMSIQHMYTSFM